VFPVYTLDDHEQFLSIYSVIIQGT